MSKTGQFHSKDQAKTTINYRERGQFPCLITGFHDCSINHKSANYVNIEKNSRDKNKRRCERNDLFTCDPVTMI